MDTSDILTEQNATLICDLIRDGVPLSELPLHNLPERKQIMRWMRNLEWFKNDVEAAMREGTLAVIDDLHSVARAASSAEDAAVVGARARTTQMVIEQYDPSRRKQANQQQVAVVLQNGKPLEKLSPVNEELNRVTLQIIDNFRQEYPHALGTETQAETKPPKRLADEA